MSQDLIIHWLKKRQPNRYTSAQIIYHLHGDLSESVIYASLQKLKKNNEIGWVWSEGMSQKSRPARYYFYKEVTNE